MPFATHQLIGPYALERLLGRGTFGEVWLAIHQDLGERRALKIPTDPRYVQQLRREGKIIYSLQHENIVRGCDMNTLNDPPYVAMEYIEGVTLRQKLKAAGKLPVAEALHILRQILAALAHAHDNGVLHRDLKPENVLLAASGQVKVTDFGLGKVQAAVSQSIVFSGSMVTGDGRSVSGTIQYMSPQQQAGEEPDVRDDIYAVGIIGCELLTGSRPAPVGIAKMLQRVGVDRGIVPVLEKALEQERSGRYFSSLDMLQTVTGLTASPGETTTAMSLWKKHQEAKRRTEEEHRRQEKEKEAKTTPKIRKRLEPPHVNENRHAGATGPNIEELPGVQKTMEKKSKSLQDIEAHIEQWLARSEQDQSSKHPQPEPWPKLAAAESSAQFTARKFAKTVPSAPSLASSTSPCFPVNPMPGQTVTNSAGIALAYIPPGEFMMGSPKNEEERLHDEDQHWVQLTRPFYIGITPVTLRQWMTVMGNNPVSFKKDNLPVVNVSWDDAVEFCESISVKEGKHYRLPTEAEWEYACRAGSLGPFAGTRRLEDMGWYKDNSGGKLHAVGQKNPNAWGIYDMHGNVWEWCDDRYGSGRAQRGGSWYIYLRFCRCATRGSFAADGRDDDIGFRLALDFP